MKTYRRILVPVAAGASSDLPLQRAAELAHAQRAQLLVVHVIDTRSGFEPDGPAARLPGESAARRAPEARKRLELQLARNNLGWAEARVVWGNPRTALSGILREWKPDLVVASADALPHGLPVGTDVLTVQPRNRLRGRLSAVFQQLVPRHA